MSIDPKALTPELLRDTCGPSTYQRGYDYYRQGRVRVLDTRPEGQALNLLGENHGRQVYLQNILLKPTRRGIEIRGYCECPMGFNCKHVVATCLAWQGQALPGGGASGGDFEQWLTRLQANSEVQAHSGDAILYLLGPAPQQRKGVELNFAIAKPKREGGWSKGRRATLSTFGNHFSTPRYMQPLDVEIIALLEAGNPYSWGGGTKLGGVSGRTALDLMLQSGRLFWGEARLGPLRVGPERPLALAWQKQGSKYQLRLDEAMAGQIIPVSPPCYVDAQGLQLGELRLPLGIEADQLDLLAHAPPVSAGEADRISRLLALKHPDIPTPKPVKVELVDTVPTPLLTLQPDPQRPEATGVSLGFCYADLQVAADEPETTLTREAGKRLLRVQRDLHTEQRAQQQLLDLGLLPGQQPGQFALVAEGTPRQQALRQWFAFQEQTLPSLEAEGWRIETGPQGAFSLSHAGAVDAEIDAQDNDWFGLHFDLDVAGRKLPLLPLVSELLADYRPGELPETLYLDAGEGEFIALKAELIEPVLQTIVELFDRAEGDTLRLSRLDAPRLLDLGETRIQGGETLQRLARRLRNFDGIKVVKPPSTFKGELRGYQQQGLNWLQFLREYELAGILADDMGLGKTVQTLAHLAVEKRAGRMKAPSLIIAPTSLMGNWRREAAQFTPKLKVLVLHGPERDRHFATLGDYDLILTTYPLLPRDGEVLSAQAWHYLILDEAQQIKNPRSQAAQLVRTLNAKHRLCLTGTPMENHLGELWAQFDFLLPGFLGDQQAFTRHYRSPIEKQGDTERLTQLTRRTTPFMLRRTKDIVASELPQKTELLRTVPIEGKQAALYESIRLTMEKKVREAIAQKGLARSHITILDALLKLRQVCCDPRLLPAAAGKGIHSAKLAMLMEILPELLDEGRRILIFSQFTTMLGLIEDELHQRKIPYSKLTGQTRKRDEAIERFRSGEVDLFLISLKAGGVGLNLTEADTVIHYDPWWNPAVESQATDRAHRIGQDKPVFVYKLITEGTVEEKILALQAKKQQLADTIYGKEKQEGESLIDAAAISELLGSVG